jgi:hypothetical protein
MFVPPVLVVVLVLDPVDSRTTDEDEDEDENDGNKCLFIGTGIG